MKNNSNANYAYDKDRERHYKKYQLLYIVVTIIVSALACIALNYFLVDNLVRKILIEIFLSVITGCIVWILLDRSMSEKEREEYEETLRDKICDALAMDNSKGLLNGYSSEKVKDVLKNCIRYFSKELADSYACYVSSNLSVLRRDFTYRVKLKEDDCGNDRLHQNIAYTRMFKPQTNCTAGYKMRCLFILGDGTLDQSLSQDNFFFREEIKYIPFIEDIKKCVNDVKNGKKQIEDLTKLLNLRLKVNGKERKDIFLDESLDDSNLLLYIPLSATDVREGKEDYLSYEGELVFEYPICDDNKFYCVFSNPTLGKTIFTFDISSKKFIITDVISMLSGCSERPKKEDDDVIFETKDSSNIFPRSGIVVQWKKK